MKAILFILIVAWFVEDATQHELSCQDNESPGGPIQTWFLMIKPPETTTYLYSNSIYPGLSKGKYNLSDPRNPVGQTLQPIYNESLREGVNYFLFNDEVPDGRVSFDQGHTKGVVLFNNENIVYIAQSVPHFPYNDTDVYGYPHTGIRYGQHLFCMTLGVDQLNELLYQVRLMWPFVYNYRVSPDALARYEHLEAIINNIPFPASEVYTFRITALILRNGGKVYAYNKNGTYGKDIYDAMISTNFDPPLSLYTETWQNGRSKLPSFCADTYFVKNIKTLDFKDFDIEFDEKHDHSKWAISATNREQYVCFGGVNRMGSQFVRGGGVYCFYDDILFGALSKQIAAVEDCPSDEKF